MSLLVQGRDCLKVALIEEGSDFVKVVNTVR